MRGTEVDVKVTSPNSQLGVSNRISNLTSIPTTEAASISNSVDMNFIDVRLIVGPNVTRAAPVSNPTSARYGDATVSVVIQSERMVLASVLR